MSHSFEEMRERCAREADSEAERWANMPELHQPLTTHITYNQACSEKRAVAREIARRIRALTVPNDEAPDVFDEA